MSETRALTISDSATKHIAAMIAKKENPDLMFRVTISGGGCSGFQTLFDWDETKAEDDITFEKDGVTIITDDASLDLIDQAELDFIDDLMGSRFQLNIPNAESTCGCGTSFSIKF